MMKSLKLCLIVFILQACSTKVEDVSNTAGIDGQGRLKTTTDASFIVGATTLASRNTYSENSHLWSDIPTQSLIQLQACVKDIARVNPIIDRPFIIKTPFGEQTRYTQADGCLTWSDLVDYAYLSDERYLDYPVTIIGPTAFPGTYPLQLALNPWPNAERTVVDLEHQSLNQVKFERSEMRSISPQKIRESAYQSSLRVSTISLPLIRRAFVNNKIELSYDLEAKLQLVRSNLQREWIQEDLSKGHFQIKMALIEFDRDLEEKFILSEKSIEVQLSAGVLKETIEFSLPSDFAPKSTSDMELYLEIHPISPPPGLIALTGVLEMNGLQGLRTQELKNIAEEMSVQKTDQLLNQYAISKESFTAGKDDQAPSTALIIDPITITPGSILNTNARQTSRRQQSMRIQSCLKESLTRTALTDTEFALLISDSNGAEERKTFRTDSNGCFNSSFQISYDLFEQERWLDYRLDFVALDGELRNAGTESLLKCNPWNQADLCYDLNYQQAPTQLDGPSPKLYLGQIGYEDQGKDLSSYRLNKFLQMSFKKNYHLAISPQVETFQGHGTQGRLTSLNFGNLEVKAYLLTPTVENPDYIDLNLSEFQFLSATKTQLRISANGEALGRISLPFYFSEVQFLNKKNLLILEVSSIENSHLTKGFYAVPFFGNQEKAGLRAVELSSVETETLLTAEIQALVESGEKELIDDPTTTTIDYYRRQLAESTGSQLQGMNRTELNEKLASTSDALSLEDLRTLSTEAGAMPAGLVKKFCSQFFTARSQYEDCKERPLEKLETQAMTHVEEILSTKQTERNGLTTSYGSASHITETLGEISTGTGFFASFGERAHEAWGEQDSISYSQGAELFLQAPAPLMMVFNAGVSQAHEVFSQKSEAKMQMTFDRSYRQLGLQKLEYNMIRLGFTARVRHCVAVKRKDHKDSLLHVCQDEDQLKRLEEEWYFIGRNDPDRGSVITDGNRVGNDQLTQVIRGRYHFNHLWEQYKAEDTIIILRELRGQNIIYEPLVKYKSRAEDEVFMRAYQDQNFPGLMTPATH